MRIDRDTCADYLRSSKLEWLITNGTGAFAMGTVAGANTRRYHGLLVASLRPPVERHVLLAKFDEEVDGVALSANQYPGTVHPTGFRHLVEFRSPPSPTWVWQVNGARLEKKIFLVEGKQTVVAEYRSDLAGTLRVRPMLAFRDYHSLSHANGSLDPRAREQDGVVEIRPYGGLPALRFHHSGARFEPAAEWLYNTEYLGELDRGLDFREDLFCPGALVFDLTPGVPVRIAATIEPSADLAAPAPCPPEDDSLLTRLEAAADQFRVRRVDGLPTVIAGYPWFTDWGRDTMICLPGLLVARGLVEEARDVIRGFLAHLNQGLIPNRFPDRGEAPEYNTADGALWMFQAVHALDEAGADVSFFYPAGKEIIEWHQRGTHHHIGVDPADGLLSAGAEGDQLTWMDAKVGDWVVTPRHGKPVEINALWYNALRLMEGWAKKLGDAAGARAFASAARQVKESFEARFWNPARNCLYDVITPSVPDPKIRPNQVFAVSLPFPLLDRARQKAVVRAVETHLLTPVGLRSLAPGEEGYRPRYEGDPWHRDGAYHQGTVWPWLIGPFVSAYVNAFGRAKKNLDHCRSLLEGMAPALEHCCLGSIAEIYDAEAPHRPAGCPAQGWSIAELIRALRSLKGGNPLTAPKLRKAAARGRVSKGEWVRRAIETALRGPSQGSDPDPVVRLTLLEAPTADIEDMLAEIESGRA